MVTWLLLLDTAITSIVLSGDVYSSVTKITLFSMLAPSVPSGRIKSTSFSVVSDGWKVIRLELRVTGVPITAYALERFSLC